MEIKNIKGSQAFEIFVKGYRTTIVIVKLIESNLAIIGNIVSRSYNLTYQRSIDDEHYEFTSNDCNITIFSLPGNWLIFDTNTSEILIAPEWLVECADIKSLIDECDACRKGRK